MNTTGTMKGGDVMTDYQFRSIIKMVLAIAANTKDLDKVIQALKELLPESDQRRDNEE